MNANMILTDSERENARENGGFLPIFPNSENDKAVSNLFVIQHAETIARYTEQRINGNIDGACFYAYLVTKFSENSATLEHMDLYKSYPIKRIRF